MAIGGNNNDLMSEINVTPFVDVMLVLLVIFMVATPMMIEGVDVTLPEASNKPLPSSDRKQLFITIDKAQNVYMDDQEVGHALLREKLLRFLENREDRRVYLKADKDVPYGIVVRVMSEIKAAGVEQLGMVTRPEQIDSKSVHKR